MTKTILPSPIGPLLIEGDAALLRSIHVMMPEEAPPPCEDDPAPGSAVAEAIRQLRAYFDRRLTGFDLPLTPATTPRGQILRDAIATIPGGETLSYGALARIAGSAPRAIGQACARNVFPIVIPCHRVVGSGGAIGHYSAGQGIITKRWLLDHERRGGLL